MAILHSFKKVRGRNRITGNRSVRHIVEIRLPSRDLAATMEKMKIWLEAIGSTRAYSEWPSFLAGRFDSSFTWKDWAATAFAPAFEVPAFGQEDATDRAA